MNPLPVRIGGDVIQGAGRGATLLSTPTLNLDPSIVPSSVNHGIYAARACIDGKTYIAAVHYGERPVFDAGVSFEVHILDEVLQQKPAHVEVELVEWLREIKDFDSPGELKKEIDEDLRRTRAIIC